jgi:hypothetical protein
MSNTVPLAEPFMSLAALVPNKTYNKITFILFEMYLQYCKYAVSIGIVLLQNAYLYNYLNSLLDNFVDIKKYSIMIYLTKELF